MSPLPMNEEVTYICNFNTRQNCDRCCNECLIQKLQKFREKKNYTGVQTKVHIRGDI